MVLESTQLPCPVCQRSQASGYRGSTRLFLHPGPLGDHIRGKHPKWAKRHPDSHLLWRRAFLSPPTSSVSGDSSCENSPVAPARIGTVQSTTFTSVVSSFVSKRTQALGAFEGVDGQAPHVIHAPAGIRNSPQTISASVWDRQLMSPEPKIVKSEVLAALSSTSEQSFHEMWSRPNSACPYDSVPGKPEFKGTPGSLMSRQDSADSLLSLYDMHGQSDVNTLPFPLKESETNATPPHKHATADLITFGTRSTESTPTGARPLNVEDWTTDFEMGTVTSSATLIEFLDNKRTSTPDSALSPSTTLLGVPSDTEVKIISCWAREEVTPQTATFTPEPSWPSDEATPQDTSFPSRESTPRKAEKTLPPVPILAGDFSLSPSESRQGAIHALRASQNRLNLALPLIPEKLIQPTQPLRPKRSPNVSKASEERSKYLAPRDMSMESDGWRSHSPDVSSGADLSPLPPAPSPLSGTPSSSEYETATPLGPLSPIIEVDETNILSPAITSPLLRPLTKVDEAQNASLDEPSTPCPKSAVSAKSVRFEDGVEDIREERFPAAYVSTDTDESEASLRDYNQQLLDDIDCLQSETFPIGFGYDTPELYSPLRDGPSAAPQITHLPAPNPPKSLSLIHCRSCFKDPCEEITATMCGHIFCNRCIVDAVINTSKCPCCSAPTLLYCLIRLDLAQ